MPPESTPRPGCNQGADESGRTSDQTAPNPIVAAEQFLRAVHGTKAGFIEVRLIEDRKGGSLVARRWFASVEALVEALPVLLHLAAGRSAAVFYGVLARRVDNAGTERDVLPGQVVWVDLDFKDFPGGEAEARERLAKFPLAPPIVVFTGHGLHVYWLLREPAEPQELKRLSKALARHLGGDHAFDAARLLRLPGTFNRKDPNNPIPVRIEKLDASRAYNASEIQEALDLVGANGAEEVVRAHKASPAPHAENLLAGGLSENVRALIDRVKRVRDAFLGQGKPERGGKGQPLDRSSSGYDFTLVLQLVRHGVRDRIELATALARRPDGVAAGKGVPYITRTVDQALALVEREEAGDAGDPAEELDFEIQRVVIFTSNPPAYAFTIDGVELHLDAGDLMSSGAFSRRFLEALHRVPQFPEPQRHPWAKIVNGWLSKADRIEQPPEASSEGALREAVERALQDLAVGEEKSDLDRGTAILLPDGRIAFRVTSLFETVREDLPDAKRQHVCRVLRELGYQPELHRVGGHPCRMWSGAQYAREGGNDASE